MSIGFKKGSTSVILYFYARKNAADGSAGDPKTGLAWNSAGALASYMLPGATRTAITLKTQTAGGAFDAGGFVEVDATNMPGLYRFDPPDAATPTSGSDFVVVQLVFDGTVVEPQLIVLPTNTTSDNYGELTHVDYGLSKQTGGGGGSGGVDPRPPF